MKRPKRPGVPRGRKTSVSSAGAGANSVPALQSTPSPPQAAAAPQAPLTQPDPGLPYAPPGVLSPPGGVLLPVGQQITHWQGPYPPPDAAERFEALSPGAFSRILDMAEQSQAAQIQATKRAQEFLQRDTRRGHWLGALVSLAAMAGAGVCAYVHEPWVAGVFLSVPVLAVARALIEGTARRTTMPPAPNSGSGTP